ncbi:hypothetical protein IV102_12090 [bacterium]|nr:hypothetical protein [bacterium]
MGSADYLFVEVTPAMGELYRQFDPRFLEFAPPGSQSAGDDYTLLALPTNPAAGGRLRGSPNQVFHAYVEAWFTKNLGPDWKETQPEALPAYQEMMQSTSPVWSQPPLPG